MPVEHRRLPLVSFALFLFTCATHATMINHPWVIDDAVQIVENPAVTHGAPLRAFLLDRSTGSTREDYNSRIYRPLRNYAFRLIAKVAGVRPLAFGLVNLILYGANAVLVLWLALLLTRSLAAATWAAALWALLPVHVEPVAYASAIGDQLSALGQLGALGTALLALDERASPRRRVVLGASSLLLALGGMLTKEMAVTTVALLGWWVLLDGNLRRQRRSWLLTGAHALLAMAYLALRTHVVGRVGQEDVTAASVATGLREAPALLVGYLRITLEPIGHRMAYLVAAPSTPALLVLLLTLVALATLAWWIDRRLGSIGVRLGLGWFVLSLTPVLHLVPLWADLADRFALIPSVGLALVAATLIATVEQPRALRLAQLGGVVLAVLYLAGTLVEARGWRSDLAVWSHAVADEPGSPLAHANLGGVLLKSGQPEQALAELDLAWTLGKQDAGVQVRRGMALEALGRAPEAESALRDAIRREPGLGRAHALLGEVLRRQHRLDEAMAELELAERFDPAHPSTSLLKGAILEQQRRYADAAQAYLKLEQLFPAEARFVYLEARAWLAAGEPLPALEAARRCLGIASAQPQCRCVAGRAQLLVGDVAGARASLDAALPSLPPGPERDQCAQARAAAQ